MMRRRKRGFMLIEVLAAFVIALLMIGPVAAIIGGVAGSFGGLDRSAQRRLDQQAAAAVAMAIDPLRSGTRTVGTYTLDITPYEWDGDKELETAGWQLYRVSVQHTGERANSKIPPLFETVRIARP